jgi:protein-tyrosine phosphatase
VIHPAKASGGTCAPNRGYAKVGVMTTVLFVCTGNLCRSPSAAWFLSERFSAVGPSDVIVESAGTTGTTSPVPRELQREGAVFGLELSAHVPRKLAPDMVEQADLIIGMERTHLRETVLANPPSFTKTFTLREIVRRGSANGERHPQQPLAEWIEQLGAGRRHLELLGASAADDIPDPMGGTLEEFRTMLIELSMLTRMLHSMIWPDHP